MLRLSASHLPPDLDIPDEYIIAQHDDVQVAAPHLSAIRIDHVCRALLDARAHLLGIPVSRIIQAIDAAARRLLDPLEPERTRVLRSLNAISGFSDAMAMHVLDRVAQDWLAPALVQLLRDELGGADAIESFARTPGGSRVRAVAPPLGLHVFAGNVPGVSVTSIVRALLVRSAVLGKSASAEPALAPAFARLLADIDPVVGRCVAITCWHGGDTDLEDAALARVGLVVHYGGAESIRDLRARAPVRIPFVEHGPRISFAVIDASSGSSLDRVPDDLARAVALFDQQGCVSPQLAYVIGTSAQARDIAVAVAHALARLQDDLPRGRISPAEAVAIRELRTRAEFAAIAGSAGEVWGPPELHYSVILSDDPAFEGTCLNRTLLIKRVPDLATLCDLLAPFAALLQTAGIAGFPTTQRLRAASSLGDAGVTRITSIADMPWPPPGWHHDGRGPLQELVRWVDLEASE